jgi:hypothetical protein
MLSNKELVERFDQAWMGHNPDAFDEIMHPGFKQYGPWVMEGREMQKKLCRMVNHTMPDEHFTSEVIFDEGDVLTRVRRGEMAFRKGFGPLPPSDEAFPVIAIESYVQKDGLWITSYSCVDMPAEIVTTLLPSMRELGVAA